MPEKKSLFGTSGIRGSVETLFTNQFCFDMGRTFAKFLKKHNQNGGVAIGMDPRSSSPRIKDSLTSGLVYEHREVYDQGNTPVPAINYILKVSHHYAGSIMVSGSHIKPHLNGIKFFAFEEEILKEHEREIEKIFRAVKREGLKYSQVKTLASQKEAEGFKVHNENRANREYQEMLISKRTITYPSWKIVVDPGDGAHSDTMPQVLTRLGLKVVEINATIQGKFFSRDTEVEGDFKELQKQVIKEKADFGIGYDSDGDRVIFIDEKGKYVPGDYTGALIAKETGGKEVVTPINTSQVVDHIGRKVIRTKVGSPYVVAKMKELNTPFGFEANGGGIFSEMLSRDGGRTTVEILNILTKSGGKISELIAGMPKFYLARDKVEYKWELKDKILEEAKKRFKGIKVEEIDGLKIWVDDQSWILFRSSQNAPEFRVFAESAVEDKAKTLLDDGVKFVKEIITQND
jgi:phosphomannomutase/phosphoglucomutase